MSDKIIYWIGTSKDDLSLYPEDVRRKTGFQLRIVQKGGQPDDFKQMSIIGKGVKEIRIWTGNTYRIFYVAQFEEAIYVLHVFEKKTQKTSKKDIELGKKRYQQMIQFRKEQEFN